MKLFLPPNALLLLCFSALAVIFGQTFENGGYLPGIGTFQPSLNQPDSTTLQILRHHRRKRPPRQVLKKPQDLDPASKCQYVQIKDEPIPNTECQPGGMACDKECEIVDILDNISDDDSSSERGCITVMEEMCGDVAKEECSTVDEKICVPVPEEICDDDINVENAYNNQTR